MYEIIPIRNSIKLIFEKGDECSTREKKPVTIAAVMTTLFTAFRILFSVTPRRVSKNTGTEHTQVTRAVRSRNSARNTVFSPSSKSTI